ncbi:MAG TPA: hypothetical protein VER12_05375 [Polyangiaceae bacterium]|nr:hypothetical protein [Polyangiaceae bacterium]
MKKGVLLLLALFLLVGCAGERAPARTAAALKGEPIAAAFCMNSRRIHYNELVYKVVYNETVTHDSVFDGLWDVDSELSLLWAKLLPQAGMHASALSALVPSSELPPDWCSALGTPSEAPTLAASIRRALLEHQINYLVLLRASQFAVSSYSFGNYSQLIVPGDLIFYNVRTNRVEFSEHVFIAGSIGGHSPRELEANDLALLKKTARELISTQGLKTLRSASATD